MADIRFVVHPRASSNSITGIKEGAVHIRLHAPPVDGKANEALIAYLSDLLKIRKSAIKIRRGHNARQKTLSIESFTARELTEFFEKQAGR